MKVKTRLPGHTQYVRTVSRASRDGAGLPRSPTILELPEEEIPDSNGPYQVNTHGHAVDKGSRE